MDRYLANMSCTLTERTLNIKKGILNKTEATIPLEKRTDLQMFQGPIMRFLDLQGFKVETAGQSGPGGALVNMIGIVDTEGVREAVLGQRDQLHDREAGGSSRFTPVATSTVASSEQVELMREMRDMLARAHRKPSNEL